jgi:O-antigen/teichoic acid export membrane protein
VLGALGGLLLAASSPWLVRDVLNIALPLRAETLQAFYLLALSLPLVVTTAGLRSLLEAHQHFGLITALRLPYAVFSFVGPLLVVPFSKDLGTVVGMLVVGRAVTWLAHLILCLRRYPFLRRARGPGRSLVKPLLRVGGWLTVSNIVSPLMVNVDRFFIGALLTMTAVTYYVTPFEMVTKLLLIPASILGVLFPAFAATVVRDRAHTARLFNQGVRAMLLVVFPITLLLVAFGREGLLFWVGPDFARESTGVLQWLAVGVYINSVGQVPYALLQGTGRPDLTAKLHLVELPIYAVAVWWLARLTGLEGVAAAWTLRSTIDTAALLMLARRHLPDARADLGTPVQLLGMSLLVLLAASSLNGAVPKVALVLIALALFAGVGWGWMLKPAERAMITRWLKGPTARPLGWRDQPRRRGAKAATQERRKV